MKRVGASLICAILILCIFMRIPLLHILTASKAERHFNRGEELLQEDYILQARDEFEWAVDEDSNYAMAWLYLSDTYDIQTSEPNERAYKYAEKARELFEGDMEKQALCDTYLAKTYLNEAKVHQDNPNYDDSDVKDKLDKGQEHCIAALTNLTDHRERSMCYQILGEVYLRQNQTEQALSAWEQGLKEADNFAITELLADYYMGQEKYETAKKYYEQTLKLEPDETFNVYSALMSCYRSLGMEDSKEAKELEKSYNPTHDHSVIGVVKGIGTALTSREREITDMSPVGFIMLLYVLVPLTILIFAVFTFVERLIKEIQFRKGGALFRRSNHVTGDVTVSPLKLREEQLSSIQEMFTQYDAKRKQLNVLTFLFYFLFPLVTVSGFLWLLRSLVGSLPLRGFIFAVSYLMIILASVIPGWLHIRRKQFAQKWKQNVVPEILAKLQIQATYQMKGEIPSQNLVRSQMLPGCPTFYSEDLIKGKYKGVNFRSADVRTVGFGGTFQGRWMIFDFPKKADDLYVYQRMQGRKTYNKKAVKVDTDYPDFNNNFLVYSKSGFEALYVLTPHFMEAVMKLEKTTSGAMILGFVNQKLHVAIDNKRDSMELFLWRKPDAKQYVQALCGDMEAVVAFIEKLKLDKDWKDKK